MFIAVEEVERLTGYEISTQRLNQAQVMIETWIGKVEQDIEDASDLAILSRATAFQAVYIQDNPEVAFEQAAVDQVTQGDAVTKFNKTMFSPFMSPWAVKACSRLSWMGSKSVKTGPVFERVKPLGWEYE